jgi:F-type H+-transporting ATPase subunit b
VSPDLATFLFEVANFAVLAAALGWAFFRPVRAAVENRRSALEAERSQAESMRREAERILADAEARRAEIEVSLEPLRAALCDDARAEAARLLAAAERRAAEERAALRAELASVRRALNGAIARDAAAATRSLVERLLAEIGGPSLDLALVRAAAERLRGLSHPDGDVVVETARPLPPEARDALASALARNHEEQRIRIVPELIAGVRVTTPAGLIDASVSGMAAAAERELVARLECPEGRDG